MGSEFVLKACEPCKLTNQGRAKAADAPSSLDNITAPKLAALQQVEHQLVCDTANRLH
jgi:hypothetical protein